MDDVADGSCPISSDATVLMPPPGASRQPSSLIASELADGSDRLPDGGESRPSMVAAAHLARRAIARLAPSGLGAPAADQVAAGLLFDGIVV